MTKKITITAPEAPTASSRSGGSGVGTFVLGAAVTIGAFYFIGLKMQKGKSNVQSPKNQPEPRPDFNSDPSSAGGTREWLGSIRR